MESLFSFSLSSLPNYPSSRVSSSLPRAPKRSLSSLSPSDKRLCISNALRYVPSQHHPSISKEFLQELSHHGHIYAFRWMPNHPLAAIPIDQIPAKSKQAAAIILMILNNLDDDIAQFPLELVTYGGNGQVFSNWIQFRMTIQYLLEMSDDQTLVIYSGHPMGLFPSSREAPRVVITNGMMIPNYSGREMYDKFFALGVTMYGQMTAGSYAYIGPQGIVHGTSITLMNAGRKYLHLPSLYGKVLVTSGLGGMSGAQAKAAVICGCIGVIAEINPSALMKRHKQGWLDLYSDDLNEIIQHIKHYRQQREGVSIGYLGNIVDLWERLVIEHEVLVELGSDQTSLHNPFNGGYYPVGLTLEESNRLMAEDKSKFEEAVKGSLLRHIGAIQHLSEKRGLHFWDYGNAFLLECHRAGANLLPSNAKDDKSFTFPSYMQDIMGDIFSLGFGPFRWVCTSGLDSDLLLTDQIACSTMDVLLKSKNISQSTREQYTDNRRWIEEADKHQLVVGSKARILYSDQEGRVQLALAFNQAVRDGHLKGPIVISRDHHDVSGTDSPFRETSNISDGSAYTADMAVQNAIGDSFRGATWVSLHNGGGVGWGDVINGGFGMLLDGTAEAQRRAHSMLNWDVSNGVARRSWAGNPNAKETIQRSMERVEGLRVTLPEEVDEAVIEGLRI